MVTRLDSLDEKAAKVLNGYLVRKDLVRDFSRQFPVPTYVVEFLLGRYCASVEQEMINEGLEIVQKQLKSQTVNAGDEELFKSRAREQGEVKIIDLITARLDARTDSYMATLPGLGLHDVRINPEMVKEHERMLTGGFYGEINLIYDAAIALEKHGRPFGVLSLREIQHSSSRDMLQKLGEARAHFSSEEWKNFLLRSVGIEPLELTDRQKNAFLLRMVPFVERNYNQVELGPRGTGKSHIFQQVSPYAHLVSGGKATVAQMFVNNSTGQRGLVCQYDVVCFDEIAGVSFDKKDGVSIMKGYMESGEFSRGKESIRADGSIVMVGNFNVDVTHQQRIGHLLGPLPIEMRNDTAFMDRIHSYLPGWDVPKICKELLTDHFGLVSDVLSECWNQLRKQSGVAKLQNRLRFGAALSGRDENATNKTISGLLKLLYPGDAVDVPDDDLEWAIKVALEARRRVKEQQKRIGAAEFRATHFSYQIGGEGMEKFVSTPELQSSGSVSGDPLEPGRVFAISCGDEEEAPGLYRMEVNEAPGSGINILNHPVPRNFKAGLQRALQNLCSSRSMIGDKDPRQHEYTVQLRTFDVSKSGSGLSAASFVALSTALMKKNIRGGLVIVGDINLGGSFELLRDPVAIAELAFDKGAKVLLMPISCRKDLFKLPDNLVTKVDIEYYASPEEILLKALAE